MDYCKIYITIKVEEDIELFKNTHILTNCK